MTAMTQSSAATLVRHLAHDIRQPLSTVENCVYYLKLVTASDNSSVQEHLDLIQREMEEVDRILTEAMSQLRLQRPACAAGEESLELTSASTSALT
jgi:nitrogen-specific signal transduction histidine kinase